jgi:hypothetical protein
MRRAVLLLTVLAFAAPAAAEVGSPIKPGYWESTSRILSPIPTKSVDRKCLTPKDVEKFMMGPENRHYDCTYPTRNFDNGKIRLKGHCVSKKGRQVQISATGTYTPTSFTLVADVQTKLAGLSVGGRASTEARRIGDVCPPGSDKPRKVKR